MPFPRVTLATYDDDPPIGGQGVYVRGLRTALVELGVVLRTVAGHGRHAIEVPHRTGRPPLDMSLHLSRDPGVLLADDTEVVHVMGGPGGVLLLRRVPVPVVYTAHHTYAQAYRRLAPRRALALAERHAYRRAAMVLCVSPSTAEVVRRLGVEPRRVEVVPPGIEVVRLDAAAGATARQPGRVLFVGRLEPEKGPLDAVAVMAALCARVSGVHGVLVGQGSLQREVEAAAAAVPGSRVRVLGGVDDTTLAREYARAEVLLMPSRYEGLGIAGLEAMALGVAVVGADVTGLRDALRHGGVLVPAGDLAAMTDAAAALLTDAPRRADLVTEARERVRREHSWARAATRVADVYTTCVAAG